MLDGVGALVPRWDSDKGPRVAEVFGVRAVLRPAAGEDLDLLVGRSGTGDVVERTIGQIIQWRGMRLKRDGFVWVWSL